MNIKLLKNFRFSPFITLCSILLALVMCKASSWQWSRYLYKQELVATYETHSGSLPLNFPSQIDESTDFTDLIHQKVALSGEYDFEHQIIIRNRRHASGPGQWLLTPLKLEGSEHRLLVSRGFIPFSDYEPETWDKYRTTAKTSFDAVVQETIPHRNLLSPQSGPQSGADGKNPEKTFVRNWLYPDLAKIAEQFPYPIITTIFVQKLGGPKQGTFPAESVSIRVPPSTHFGYSIEWALLAIASLVIGFLLQAFPRRKKTKDRQRYPNHSHE